MKVFCECLLEIRDNIPHFREDFYLHIVIYTLLFTQTAFVIELSAPVTVITLRILLQENSVIEIVLVSFNCCLAFLAIFVDCCVICFCGVQALVSQFMVKWFLVQVQIESYRENSGDSEQQAILLVPPVPWVQHEQCLEGESSHCMFGDHGRRQVFFRR